MKSMVTDPSQRTSHRPPIQARHFVASSGHYLATAAAHRVRLLGGNAIDAGVAAGICINVLLPDLTNFGGVAPTLVYSHERNELRSISGLGYWGKDASLEFYQRQENGKIPIGARRSIIPGAPDAWLTALARYGRLSFEQVVTPAIELCEQGFVVYPSLHRNLAKNEADLRRWKSSAEVFLPGGRVPEVGEVFYQKDLGRTFRRMVEAERAASSKGRAAAVEAARDEFYRGDIGKEIAAFITAEGGFITEEDLAGFHSDIEEPPTVNFRGVDVYGCGPWCQGPVLLETLNILEGFDLKAMGHNSADYLSTIVQALDLSFSDRESYCADPKFVDVPLDELLSKEYAARQRARIDPNSTFTEMPPPGDIRSLVGSGAHRGPLGTVRTPVEPDTSYVCVVDEEGNAFSATPSDGVSGTPVIPGLGLICSGRGNQSRVDPNHPASLQPGKRPRLTPNPAMAFKDGKLYMPFGTPGGDMQPQSMLQVFLNIVEFGMNPQQAIEQPRIGTYNFPNSFAPHTYLPGVRQIETRIGEDVIEELRARGHTVEPWPEWTRMTGNVCAITVDHERGTFTGGADARAEAYAIGW
jgi:gamma-glutamyltranspeptidase / glutathione hydrolase